jgi:hypothetical protein
MLQCDLRWFCFAGAGADAATCLLLLRRLCEVSTPEPAIHKTLLAEKICTKYMPRSLLSYFQHMY